MSNNKRRLTDIQILAICHFVALVFISLFGANVFELVEKLSGTMAGKLLLPINRSIWEFSKMLLVPICIIFIVEYLIVGKRIKNFIPIHLIIAFLLPIALIIIMAIFNFFFGELSMQGAQAVLFLTVIIAAFLLSIALVTSKRDFSKYVVPFLIMYIILCGLYVGFSFIRPQIGLFFDFGANTYGPLY